MAKKGELDPENREGSDTKGVASIEDETIEDTPADAPAKRTSGKKKAKKKSAS